jgi:AraC-like DNA-binding protein
VSALIVGEYPHDMQRVAIPRPEIHLAVRFGPNARHGLDAHALGVREKAVRKLIRSGQRTVLARLHLGAHVAVFGVPASEIAGRIVALEDLWGEAAARRFFDRLAGATDMLAAAAIVESAIAERVAAADTRSQRAQLSLNTASMLTKLTSANVNSVAGELGVSDRHMRRVFRETLGMSPKTFAKLMRFERALRAAHENNHASWANIAAASGYYDQAHLIAECRGMTGVTPQVLLDELRKQATLD